MASEILADVLPFTRKYKRSRGAKARNGNPCPVVQLCQYIITPKDQFFMDKVVEIFTGCPMEDGTMMSKQRAMQLALNTLHKVRAAKRSRGW